MNNTLLEIYEFSIRPNTLYEVTEKIDSFAPDGFKEHKTSKVLHPDISDSVPGAIFNSELGVWDTGLYENSPALMRAIPSEAERIKFSKDVKKYISDPLTKLKGKEFLSQYEDNNKFWDKYSIEIFRKKVFNTGKPEELLQLYLALLHRQITPKPLENHPDFKNSQYCIIDKDDSINRKLEAELGVMEAIGIFSNLLKNKKADLLLILDYLRMNVAEKTEDRIIASLFNNWLKDKTDGYQNYSVFLKTYNFFLTEDGETEVFYNSKVKDLIKKGVIKQKKQEVWFNDEYVGSDVKSAVKNIISRKDLQTEFLKHIE